MRWHVISAVFRRNVASYFSGILGYLFIVVFVVAGAFLAFNPEFFANNLATLDQLSERFPLLLLFIIPAVTMTIWADERKLGTDELLFTLPARDSEILIGKYLAVLLVYTIALAFSITHALVLAFIGSPDWGLIATTYFGYWLSGAALLSFGMLASALTSSATVAFVLGVVLCAIPVFIDAVPFFSELLRPLSFREQFQGFAAGTVPLASVFYFVSLAVFMLYLNSVLISRRHWQSRPKDEYMGWQFFVRALALATVLISLNYVAAVASGRIDMTSENLYTLSPTTEEVVENIPRSKPVTIQAFVSPRVPQEYVPVRKKLLGLLRQLDDEGGAKLQVRYVDVEPFSEEADQAQQYGITPRNVQSEYGGRITADEIFLGAVISSGFDQVVVPFFDRGTAVEYELTRSIGTVSNEERLTVGILETDARVGGGMDMNTFRTQPEWRIVTELKKQYNVIDVSPDEPIENEELDVLIAVLPSSLTDPQMDNLVEYVRSGRPVLIFDDPVPVFDNGRGFSLAPLNPKPSQGGMMGMSQPGEPKADGGRATRLVNALEIQWLAGQTVFDQFNPHPQYADVITPELIFITTRSGTRTAVNPDSPITAGLQELMVWFPGSIRPRANSPYTFTPLLRTSQNLSGTIAWEDMVIQMPLFGPQINPDPPHITDDEAHVIAGRIQGEGENAMDAVFVADTDIVSNTLFQIQEGQLYDLRIDNITFVLNAVDVLAGDPRFIALRSRRPEFRTLSAVEREKARFTQELNEKRREAEEEADESLEQARERFRKEREQIEQNETLDRATKAELLRIAQQNETRRLEQEEREIERRKNEEIRSVRNRTERQVRRIENRVWFWAVLLPPLPAILLGIAVLSTRLVNETKGVSSERLVKR